MNMYRGTLETSLQTAPGLPFLPSYCVQSSPQHSGTHIATGCRHACHSSPGVCANVIGFHRGEMCSPIKSANNINMIIQQSNSCPWKGKEGRSIEQKVPGMQCTTITAARMYGVVSTPATAPGKPCRVKRNIPFTFKPPPKNQVGGQVFPVCFYPKENMQLLFSKCLTTYPLVASWILLISADAMELTQLCRACMWEYTRQFSTEMFAHMSKSIAIHVQA